MSRHLDSAHHLAASSARPDSSTAATANEVAGHAYREASLVSHCTLCSDVAVFRCMRCGRSYCSLHASVNECCPDCETAFSRITAWVGLVALLPSTVPSAVALLVFGMQQPFLGVLSVGLSALVWMLLVATGKWVARRIFLSAHRRQERLLEGARLKIAARSHREHRFTARRRSAYGHRTRGELPSVPIYQRTYGVG